MAGCPKFKSAVCFIVLLCHAAHKLTWSAYLIDRQRIIIKPLTKFLGKSVSPCTFIKVVSACGTGMRGMLPPSLIWPSPSIDVRESERERKATPYRDVCLMAPRCRFKSLGLPLFKWVIIGVHSGRHSQTDGSSFIICFLDFLKIPTGKQALGTWGSTMGKNIFISSNCRCNYIQVNDFVCINWC